MRIFNTMSKTKENLFLLMKMRVKIYACGPTVYNFIHIGNARPLCVFDVLRRYLEYRAIMSSLFGILRILMIKLSTEQMKRG